MNPAGSALVYSTYLGGSGGDGGSGITIDPSGNAYVTGYTDSSDFPTTPGAFQTSFYNDQNAFITKMSTPTPLISIVPVSFNYGNLVVGQTSPPQSFVVTNTGTADLIISSVTITGTNAPAFHITSDLCSGSSQPPAATCTIMAAFAPVTPGPKSAAITIVSNTANAPVLNVPLSGTGAAALPMRGLGIQEIAALIRSLK